MAKSRKELEDMLIMALEQVNECTETLTRSVNFLPDYYENILVILNLVSRVNDLHVELNRGVALVREATDDGFLSEEESVELQARFAHVMRTDEWVTKNHELALEATKKLAALEDVTLQFYDNQHPDVVIT